MKNEESSNFPAATIKIENVSSEESVFDKICMTGVRNLFETSSVNNEEILEEKVKFCEQLTDSQTDVLIKVEKREREENLIPRELVSQEQDLCQDLSKVECDSKALLRIVKQEKIEVSFGDESQSELRHCSNFGNRNFSNEEKKRKFSHSNLAYVTVVLKDLFPKNCVRGSGEIELLTDESFPCVYSKGEFKLLRKQLTDSVMSNRQSLAGSKKTPNDLDEKRRQMKTLEDSGNHVKAYFSKKPFLCPHCPSAFRFKLRFKKHLTVHSGGKLYSCAHCSMTFSRKETMADHIATHLPERPFECSQCTKVFKRKHYLNLHSKSHTGEKPYSCPQCAAKFSRKGYLRGHLLTHSDEKPYSCDQCPSKFKCKSNLNKHKRMHSGRTDRCPLCFVQFRALRKHECPLSEILYRCAYCRSKFKSKSGLRLHLLRVHLGILKMCKNANSGLQYHCAHCDRRFKKKYILRSHIIRVHIEMEKLFRCSQCRYEARSVLYLKLHQLSHSDEKPFACYHCPAKFKRSTDLKRHAMSHTDERPFSCDKCQKAFRRKEHLRKHSCKKR